MWAKLVLCSFQVLALQSSQQLSEKGVVIIGFPECPNLQSCCMRESLFRVRQWLQEPGVSHHSAALPPALASKWVLHSSDTNPSSKDEVACGEYLCRIFVVSAAWMPPPSLSDSFLFWWVSHQALHDLQLHFLFKGKPLPLRHQAYLTGHLWMFCWSFPGLELPLLCQCLLFFRLEKHQSILTYQNISIHRPGLMSDLFFIQCPLGMGGSPEGRPGNPLQYFRLENPMDRGAWWDTVHGVAESQTQMKWLSRQQAMSSS